MRAAACILILFALVFPGALSAQSIRGMVVEDGTGEPIAGATIQLLGLDSTVRGTVTSGRNGWFVVSTKQAGRFLLRPTHPSYAGDVREVAVRGREAVTVLLRMGRAAIPLEPLQVTARSNDRARQFYERASRGGQGRFITRDQIDKRVANRPTDLLKMLPEIESVTNGSVRMRSLGDVCRPAIFLDGLLANRDPAFDLDGMITTELIEGIEVFRSYVTAPVDMQLQAAMAAADGDPFTNLTCGIVAVWTRGPRGGPVTLKRVGIAAGVLAAMLLVTR